MGLSFQNHYIPSNGRDIELGFEDETISSKNFMEQELYPLKNN
jgi:hypothetical protein